MEDYLKRNDEEAFTKRVFDALNMAGTTFVYHGERNIIASIRDSNELYNIKIEKL